MSPAPSLTAGADGQSRSVEHAGPGPGTSQGPGTAIQRPVLASVLVLCCSYLLTSEWRKVLCFVQDTFAFPEEYSGGGDCSPRFLSVVPSACVLRECGCARSVLVLF